VVVEGVTVTDPETASPVGKFVPVQAVAFVEAQVSVDDSPLEIELGFADRDAVGVITPLVKNSSILGAVAAPPRSKARPSPSSDSRSVL